MLSVIEVEEVSSGGFPVAIVVRSAGQGWKSAGVKRLTELPPTGATLRLARGGRGRVRATVVKRLVVGLPSCSAVLCVDAQPCAII